MSNWLPGYDAWKTNVPEERPEKPERDWDIALEDKRENERLRREWEKSDPPEPDVDERD